MADFDCKIHELLPHRVSVADSMRQLIDAHAAEYPSGNWTPFYEIDYDHEIRYLQQDWFSSVIENDQPASVPIAEIWFGLFEPIRGSGRNRETVADCYVAGARHFQLEGSSDWAVDPEYFPDGRYANSNVLANIYRAAYGPSDGLKNDALEYLCLGYVAFALKFILADVDPKLILGSEEPVGVAAGWDSGDPLYVGFLTRDGFQVREHREAIAGIEKRRKEFDKWLRERHDDLE
ncbi:MAG: hypothetical protein ACR2FY_24295 [Pirellulaceae bacterium]